MTSCEAKSSEKPASARMPAILEAAVEATASELAERAGYRSEAAFSRAFKRVVGKPPGAVRREAESWPEPTAAPGAASRGPA